jgi:hypothetical protein
MQGHMQESINLPHKSIMSLLGAMIALAPIAVFNSYIFEESNLPFLLILVVSAAIAFGHSRIPRGIVFPGITFSFLLLLLYAWVRLDDPWNVETGGRVFSGVSRPGFLYILDLVMYYLLFILSALIFYKRGRLTEFLWFLICGYIAAFILRNSFSIGELQEGYSLSPGFVLIPLIPLLFLRNEEGWFEGKFVPYAFLLLCVIWLAVIGARTAVAALIGFFLVLWLWPIITRNRVLYYGAFWATVLMVILFNAAYMFYAATASPDDALFQESLVEDSDVGVLQKRLGTRVDIWLHLMFYIVQEPWLGYGTDHETLAVNPVPILPFSVKRDNLSAHSTYFEIMYRWGITGILVYLVLLFSIWRTFWIGRKEWAVRVAAAFFLAIIFFGSTGEYMVLSTMQLRSGFGWIVLGIGAGACLRAIKTSRREQRRPGKDQFRVFDREPQPRHG